MRLFTPSSLRWGPGPDGSRASTTAHTGESSRRSDAGYSRSPCKQALCGWNPSQVRTEVHDPDPHRDRRGGVLAQEPPPGGGGAPARGDVAVAAPPGLLSWDEVAELTRDQLRSAAGTPPVSPSESSEVRQRWYDFPTFFTIPDFRKTGNKSCPICQEAITPVRVPVRIACARGCPICLECMYTWRSSVPQSSPRSPDRCPKCQGLMIEEDREKERVLQAWEAQGYAAYLRDTSQSVRTWWESRTQVRTPQPNVAQAPVIPRPCPAEDRPPSEIPWRAEGPQRTRLPLSEDKWVRWKWKDMTGEEQRAVTAISLLAGPTEDAVLREYCTEQGTLTPRDLDFLSGSEVSTLQDIDYIWLLSGRNRLLVDWEATILMLSCA